MKKKIKKFGLIFLVILIGLLFIKDILIQTAITTVGSKILGAPVKVGQFSLSLLSQKIRIRNLKIYNPPGFPKEPLIDIPEIGVDYDLGALIFGKLHLPLVIVNLKELVVVKNEEGKLNVDSLKVTQDKKEEKKSPEETKPKEKAKDLPMQIDVVKLNVERVILKDYTKGENPVVQVWEVALKDKTFKNIKSPQQLITLVMVNAMGPTAIQSAGLYAAATVLGVGFLPAGVAGVLLGDDDNTKDFPQNLDKVYAVSLNVIKKIGEVKGEDKAGGQIKAKVDGSDIVIKVTRKSKRETTLFVSARKFMIPKPEVANGVLYQISQELK